MRKNHQNDDENDNEISGSEEFADKLNVDYDKEYDVLNGNQATNNFQNWNYEITAENNDEELIGENGNIDRAAENTQGLIACDVENCKFTSFSDRVLSIHKGRMYQS